MPRPKGFTLIEVLVALAIVVLLALLANDPDPRYTVMAKVREGLARFEAIKPQMAAHYQRTKAWPGRNRDAAIPEDGFLESKGYSFHVQADGGVLLRIHTGKGELGAVSLRPALGARGDVVWLCGDAAAPAGYAVVGADRTTLKRSERELPKECAAR
jgi:prepilin-type N-terminal cleavage/methylation domain-containing protein